MPIASLSYGCLMDIFEGVVVEKPVVQILGKKLMSSKNHKRYRIRLSDGKYQNSYAMLAEQLNHYVDEGQLADYTIVRIDGYTNSMAKNIQRILIIKDLTILNTGLEVKEKLGNPLNIVTATKPDQQQPADAAPIPGAPSNPYDSASMNTKNIGDRFSLPISGLNPYQYKWVIKAQVTAKSAIRTYNNAKGEGKWFTMDLMDESSEIRATAFNAECDKYYEIIQVDEVYLISRCALKPASHQFNTLKNDYELNFTSDTLVEECLAAKNNVPTVQYNFIPLAQLVNLAPQTLVDCIGVCRETGDLFQFTAKTSGQELKKKVVNLVDGSNTAISLTLWGPDAEQFDGSLHPIVLVKNGRINDFGGGKTLSAGAGSSIKINPDISEGHKLRIWFDNGGGSLISGKISARTGFSTDWMDFMDVKNKNLGNGEKPDYFMCKAVVNIVRNANSCYKSCPTLNCNKKVIEQGNGTFRCEKCNAEFPNFKYRLLLSMSISDWCSNRWVTCYSDLAELLLKKSAHEVGEALDINKELDESYLSSIAFKTYVFKLRTKAEFYEDSLRNKITVVAADPIKYSDYNKYLIENLQRLTGINRTFS